MPIADNLKYWMDVKHVTTAQVSKKCGVPESTITKIRTRVTLSPNMETLKCLAKALDITVNDLVDDPILEDEELRDLLPKSLPGPSEELLSQILTTLRNQRIANDRSISELRKDRNTWRKIALFALAILIPISLATLVLTAVTYWDLCHLDRGFIRQSVVGIAAYKSI